MKNWYSEKELKDWLMKQKYSENIASELAPFLSKHYNLALKKGEENVKGKIREEMKKFNLLVSCGAFDFIKRIKTITNF